MLIYAARPDVKLKYDGVSIFLCIVLVCGAGCGAIVGRALEYYDPAVSQAEEQLRADCEAKTTELLTAQPDLQQKIADISANIELHYRSGGAQDIEPQAGDYLNLYVTIWPEACATREDFAALARQIMDACAGAGLPYTTYRFDTLQQGITDGMVTYELYVGGDWRRAADAGALARSVQETYWYTATALPATATCTTTSRKCCARTLWTNTTKNSAKAPVPNGWTNSSPKPPPRKAQRF